LIAATAMPVSPRDTPAVGLDRRSASRAKDNADARGCAPGPDRLASEDLGAAAALTAAVGG